MGTALPKLFEYVQEAGQMYGVEDIAIFLYSLARMHKPQLVVDLGSGCGACCLMCGAAVQQNGAGKVMSFDDGSQWASIRDDSRLSKFQYLNTSSYGEFLSSLISQFDLNNQIDIIAQHFPPFPDLPNKIDFLISDYDSSITSIIALLRHFLPKMSASSSIFIDGASSSIATYLFLERITSDLNAGKMPECLYDHVKDREAKKLIELIRLRRIILVHLTRQRDTQNSTAWLKLEPVDYAPFPRIAMG